MQRNTNKLTFDASPNGKVKVMMIKEWSIHYDSYNATQYKQT